MATIKEVANDAGVSVATVSRVLNTPEKVNEETRQKVQEAIDRLHYSPNAQGRNLRVACTKNILVILPTIASDYYSRILSGIRHRADEDGYNIILGVTEGNEEVEKAYIAFLDRKVVDGVIFVSPKEGRQYLEHYVKRYPIVQCGEYGLPEGVATVAIDNRQAAYDATNYLIGLGHTKIAFIGSKEVYTSVRQRKEGFEKALEEAGMHMPEAYYECAKFSYSGGREACARLLALDEPPTAIFTIADSIAVGAIKKAQELGVKVGHTVDIMGFDDTAIAKMYCPSITTIAQPRFELGETACNMLLDRKSVV